MGKIIGVHSFRGGTGKSNITANLAFLMCEKGKRVGIVDCDIQSPGIHILFQLPPEKIEHTLNDYLRNQCALEDVVYEIIPDHLFLIPSSLQAGEITKFLREGYDAEKLISGLHEIVDKYKLDYLFLDTHPGLNEETLLSISITDQLIVVLRPDQQDYQGTAVTVEIAKKLEAPSIHLIANKCPKVIDHKQLTEQLQSVYEIPVAGVLPLSEDLALLGSSGVFVEKYPDHEITHGLKSIFNELFQL